MNAGQFFDPEEGLEPTPDLEVGRFALRSFKFNVEPQSESLGARLGWWTDGAARVFRPIIQHGGDGWEDGTCEAVCLKGSTVRRFGGDVVRDTRRSHQAPDENCECGIYASLTYADLLDQYRSYARQLVAVIAAEGITIIGTRGLRTQFARVVAYWADPALPYHRDVAARQFKDATVFECPTEMIETHGLQLLPPASAKATNLKNYWTP